MSYTVIADLKHIWLLKDYRKQFSAIAVEENEIISLQIVKKIFDPVNTKVKNKKDVATVVP